MSSNSTKKTSRISGFYKLNIKERLEKVAEFANLNDEEKKLLMDRGLELDIADKMIENVVGTFELPLGIAMNFLIDGKDYLIPMAIEEPSVVAAASNAAKVARAKGGFITDVTPPVMIGQIQITNVKNPFAAKMEILRNKDEIIEKANEQDSMLVKLGGGCRDVEVKVIDTMLGPMVIVHLLVDVRDAMGANAVNTMAEAVAPYIEQLSSGKVRLRIVSNLAKYRLARAKAIFAKDIIGEDAVEGIIQAYAFAKADPFRCATHNKGIMNGVSAVVIATGNDFRAVEAGAHSYAAFHGKYKPLTCYEVNEEGDLVGTIEIPTAIGIVGGATRVNPLAQICLKILGVKKAEDLSRILAAVGLAQNFAALKALATEGIQRGHMELHARNIAISAGATREEVDKIVEIMVKEKKIKIDYAKELLEKLREKGN